MIKAVNAGNQIVQVCANCKKENTINVVKATLKDKNEYGECDNFPLPACSCGCLEVLNMNLPDDETAIANKIPDLEWTSRHLIKNVKKFHKGLTTNIDSTVPTKPTK